MKEYPGEIKTKFEHIHILAFKKGAQMNSNNESVGPKSRDTLHLLEVIDGGTDSERPSPLSFD